MPYVLGIDLGTSAVKTLLINKLGEIVAKASSKYELLQPKKGYSEQNPDDWVIATKKSIRTLLNNHQEIDPEEIQGVSYSGQMHGLVLSDHQHKVLRPAILWNDTRTTSQVEKIKNELGDRFVQMTGNKVMEGFTLPKILWIQENEPDVYSRISVFMLPKDYVRFKMTGKINTDYSDAAGTVMTDVSSGKWSKEILQKFDIDLYKCPPILESKSEIGLISADFAREVGLSLKTKVFAGAADNACGALGAGILNVDRVLESIGTSGVLLAYEPHSTSVYKGNLHLFNHAVPGVYYSMGVTLSAGFSLSWFHHTFAKDEDLVDLVASAKESAPGANGLIFTPYIEGERTPYPDASIRGSFIGIDSRHTKADFVRAILEGIIFSFRDIQEIYKKNGRTFTQAVSIGGGAKSRLWLQIQANILNIEIISLKDNEGAGLGAGMIAAVGLGWFDTFTECAEKFVRDENITRPQEKMVKLYSKYYSEYRKIFSATQPITKSLVMLNS